MDLDLAFSQKKRGRWSAEACRHAALLSLLVFSPLSLWSLCLSRVCGDTLFASFGEVEPQTPEELPARRPRLVDVPVGPSMSEELHQHVMLAGLN